jgi:predicted Zn-dependent protease
VAAESTGGAQRFFSLVDALARELEGHEVLLASLAGEDSAFVRFNQSRVRQAGTVSEDEIVVDLVDGERHAQATATLTADGAADLGRLREVLASLRDVSAQTEPDPFSSYAAETTETWEAPASSLPASEEMAGMVLRAAARADLVGILASGPIRRGFASSLGARNWFESDMFHLDVSFHGVRGAAVKVSLGGTCWEPGAIEAKLAEARARLALLETMPREPAPGRYRAYLAPGALDEIFGLLAWGGFGLEAHRTRQTPLLKMTTGDARFADAVTLRERRARGDAPSFTSRGFRKPSDVVLVEGGRYRDCLVDARSAKRYGAAVNAEVEWPESLEMDPGDLPAEDALAAVGDGLYISDCWYTNFSDRNECRITGMTRYACFWVEGGRIAAPLAPMRFDDSLYELLGSGLVAITRERERRLDQRTYGGRSLRGMLLPGIVVSGLRIAL